jgi:polyisoprenoid-binding protein YceI
MKHFILSVAAMSILVLPVFAHAAAWNIDPDHSSAGFKVRHMMVSNVKGEFTKFKGAVNLDDRDITKSKVEVTFDTASVNTGVVKRDDHLKGAEFFDVAKYPTMTFVSRSVKKTGNGKLLVTGDLNLHGVTKEVVLDVEGPSAEVKDPRGNVRLGASATAKINRKDFGLAYNKAIETGGMVVGEEVTIILEVEMVKDK